MDISVWRYSWREPVDLEQRVGNVISLAIVALLGWVAFTVHQDSKDIAVMKSELHQLRQDFYTYRRMNGSEAPGDEDAWHANKTR